MSVWRVKCRILTNKHVTELFLARPFGAKSLMQRMLSLSMSDDMKEAKSEKVKLLEELGNDQELMKKVENFVSTEAARNSIDMALIEGKKKIIIGAEQFFDLGLIIIF